MVFENICVFVLWMRVASALEGLTHWWNFAIQKNISAKYLSEFSSLSKETTPFNFSIGSIYIESVLVHAWLSLYFKLSG